MIIEVKVSPRSSRSKLQAAGDNKFKAYVKAASVKGRANQELIGLLVDWFGCLASDVVIKKGATSRNKLIEIKGVDQQLF